MFTKLFFAFFVDFQIQFRPRWMSTASKWRQKKILSKKSSRKTFGMTTTTTMKWTVTILKMTHEILYFVKLYNVFMKLTNMGKSTILVVFLI